MSSRRNPIASLRRSPARHSTSTSSRSRAERHARNSATASSSLARLTRVLGTCTWWRARIPQPPRAVLTARLRRQAPTVGQVGGLPHHRLRNLALVDRERQEAPHAGQNSVDPPRPTHLIGTRTGQHHRRARPTAMRRGMPQPQHERPQPISSQPPIQMCHNAPRQIQRHRTGVTLGRRLGVVAAEHTCHRFASATGTGRRSSSITVQYRVPEGSLTGNGRNSLPPTSILTAATRQQPDRHG